MPYWERKFVVPAVLPRQPFMPHAMMAWSCLHMHAYMRNDVLYITIHTFYSYYVHMYRHA